MSINPSNENREFSPASSVEQTMKPQAIGERKEIFRTLVMLQDQGETVKMSRIRVSVQFNITPEVLADIEREGIASNWPPL